MSSSHTLKNLVTFVSDLTLLQAAAVILPKLTTWHQADTQIQCQG